VNMIRAGEIGGFLEAVLQRLAEYLDQAQTLRDDVKSALTYPVLLTCAMGGSLLVLLVYVLPKFSALFSDMGKALPLQARIILALSAAIRGYWWVFLLAIAIGTFVFRRTIQTPRGRYSFDAWKLRVVLIGPMLRKMEVASLGRTLGTLLKSGVPMLGALGVVKEMMGNQVMANAVESLGDGVRRGAGLSKPMEDLGIFPALATHMVRVGEETGRLEEMLLKVGVTFETDTRKNVKRLIALVEPGIILVMGLVVGFIVVAMLMAIVSITDIPI